MKTSTKIKELPKEVSSFAETGERVSKIALELLIFLMPILFLPWTVNVLEFNKQALLIVMVLIALFAWFLKVLISGKVNFSLSLIHLPLIVLFLVYLFSTIFSLWPYGSFWGWPQITSESLLSLLGLVLFYFLLSNIFERKEIFNVLALFILSGSLAMLYGILQLFGKFFLPIGFTKTASFNTIGGVNNLGIFAAGLLPLIIICLVAAKKIHYRVFFFGALVVSTVLLLLINFQIAWWLLLTASVLIIVFGFQRRDIFDGRWLVLPIFFLVLALLFSFFRFQIPGFAQPPVEVFLKQQPSFSIAWQALRESPIFGTGPGTFVYNFSKYKALNFNQDFFWNLRFEWAGSKILTILGTNGILGVLAFLTLLGFFVFYGIRFLLVRDRASANFWLPSFGVFISFLVLSIGFFLYGSNLTIDFTYFLILGSTIVIFAPPKKEFILKPSSLLTLGLTFTFTVIFIFGLGIFILEGQRYIASVSCLKGIELWQQGQNEKALKQLERAVKIAPQNDFYWQELSQLYIQNINEIAKSADLSQEEVIKKIQFYINNAVNSTKEATNRNPENVVNWSVQGFVYQSLIGVVGGTKDQAVISYERAGQLEPTNPYFPTQTGISLLKEAETLTQDKQGEREKLLSDAQEKFEKAIELKTDYAPARFQMAMVYQAKGKEAEMLEELEKTKDFAPNDIGLAFQLGLVYYQRGNFERAKTELERTTSLNPNYANALYFLGLTYEKLGRRDDAIKIFERVVALNPDHPIATAVLNNLKTGQEPLKGVIEEQPPQAPIKE
ncbi:MAG: hypothetical protein COU42_00175 [Candidatus Nealsonbacteria bacterium CG10_big_fil_rev_8_21_14_0_10_36_24]|uniref:UDP-N-acetylglucosamine--peptide N-acetylglucosaminyltransferase SPINDLY n=2 Tax=Candidatus Nealsoniibacteriota TaxID=1817911 RepID=A0A2H0YPD6_9BACT|nr:MAG: hypothetical protein COU42_00175 [Candidatus Nealsonbacteria bacterium CG10_big_fil_rev_8_21_14_0_10_36_24]PIS40365.1 MAG: hypothetical protein COT32_00170 [Candidatus Nealsonbacteria bacterium CG08_land_8_20_14_0_20_36_22]